MNTRALAALVLTDVNVGGRSLPDALASHHPGVADPREQALLQEISYGVTRWWWRLDAIISQLLDKPLKAKDGDIKHLIMAGIYQLDYMRIPDHAAVAETVNACADLKKIWAKKLVNGVLRNYQRRSKAINRQLTQQPDVDCSHPRWLMQELKAAWPDQWPQIVAANNNKPPMVLRVNIQKTTRDDYLQQLLEQDIQAQAFPFNDCGVQLAQPVAVQNLPGFDDGLVSVQDGAAQLAADLLQLEAGQRVLDVCAAPGGKTAHILERQPALSELVAVDIDGERLAKVDENLQRLGLAATLVAGDALVPDGWWDGRRFDRILLDAPCSATGVIRRHPDIKQLRRAADVPQLVNLQHKILAAVWSLLESGGMLLYATCSVLPQENERQIRQFIASNQDSLLLPIAAQWGTNQPAGRQILPGQHGMDGFYYACIQKK
jgi:16S rRNA (cytosine967-C5)-methyltransferase